MTTATVLKLPDQSSRRERQLTALWAQEDKLEQQLRELRATIRPLQREVSLDRGFLYTVSREVLQRPERKRS